MFQLNDIEIKEKQFNVRYSAAANRYERFIRSDNAAPTKTLAIHANWSECTLEYRNVARKVEPDWKMAYLARTEASERAVLSWKFDFTASGLRISTVQLRCVATTYETGVVDVELLDECGEDNFIFLKTIVKFAKFRPNKKVLCNSNARYNFTFLY